MLKCRYFPEPEEENAEAYKKSQQQRELERRVCKSKRECMMLETAGKLNDYLADLNEQAEAMFSRLVKQLSEKEGVTEAIKVENQMLWVQRMNNIRSAAMEIVSSELIYC